MKTWMNENKKIVYGVLAVIIVIVAASIVMGFAKAKKVLVLAKDKTIVEYGKAVSQEPKSYLKEVNKDITKDIKVSTDLKNEENKEYPSVGNYNITFTYKKEKVTVIVEVKDTVAPVFNDCNSVEFLKGSDFNYNEYIKATDLQDVEVTFDTNAVNKDVAGEYTIKAIAIDESNNKVEKDIKVKVLEVDTTSNDTQVAVEENGNVVVKVTEKPKETTDNTTSTNVSSNTNANANANTNTNTNSSNNSNQSNSNISSNNSAPVKPTTPAQPEQPKVEQPHQHRNMLNNNSFISPVFKTREECDKWAENYLDSDENFYNTKYSGYGSATCECGEWGVTNFY